MATTSSTQTNSKDDALGSEIKADIAKLTKDVAELAHTLSAFGKARIDDLQDPLSALPDDIQAASSQALKDLRQELDTLEAKIGTHVKDHPMQSLLLAVGLGAFLALLLRR